MVKEIVVTEEEESVVVFLISVLEGLPSFCLTAKVSPAGRAFLEEVRDRLWGDLCFGAPPRGFSVSPDRAVTFCNAVARFRHHWRNLEVECATEKTERGQNPRGHGYRCVARQIAVLLEPIATRFESELLKDDSLEF